MITVTALPAFSDNYLWLLAREGREAVAQACFDFIPTRAALDLSGWTEEDVFAH